MIFFATDSVQYFLRSSQRFFDWNYNVLIFILFENWYSRCQKSQTTLVFRHPIIVWFSSVHFSARVQNPDKNFWFSDLHNPLWTIVMQPMPSDWKPDIHFSRFWTNPVFGQICISDVRFLADWKHFGVYIGFRIFVNLEILFVFCFLMEICSRIYPIVNLK